MTADVVADASQKESTHGASPPVSDDDEVDRLLFSKVNDFLSGAAKEDGGDGFDACFPRFGFGSSEDSSAVLLEMVPQIDHEGRPRYVRRTTIDAPRHEGRSVGCGCNRLYDMDDVDLGGKFFGQRKGAVQGRQRVLRAIDRNQDPLKQSAS